MCIDDDTGSVLLFFVVGTWRMDAKSKGGGTRRSKEDQCRRRKSPWSSPCYKSILLDNVLVRADPHLPWCRYRKFKTRVRYSSNNDNKKQQQKIRRQYDAEWAPTKGRRHTVMVVWSSLPKTGPERNCGTFLTSTTTSGGINESGTNLYAARGIVVVVVACGPARGEG
jgi:hypothetical protein